MANGETKPVLVVDGARFTDFDGFAREFSRLLRNYEWHGNLDAFNDILAGGFGTPEGGFILRFVNSDLARTALGYAATVMRLKQVLTACHPTGRERVVGYLDDARRDQGPTLFDSIVEIIERHGTDGEYPEDGVELDLA